MTTRAGKTGDTSKRTTKTPTQRATEAYDRQARIVKRLTDKLAPARAEVVAVEGELEAAKRRLSYLGSNPDLPEGYGASDEPDAPLPEGGDLDPHATDADET